MKNLIWEIYTIKSKEEEEEESCGRGRRTPGFCGVKGLHFWGERVLTVLSATEVTEDLGGKGIGLSIEASC